MKVASCTGGRNFKRTWSSQRRFVTRLFTPFLPAPLKEEIKLSNGGVSVQTGPFEWIFAALISATANRWSSKRSTGSRGGSGGKGGFRITLPGFGSVALVD